MAEPHLMMEICNLANRVDTHNLTQIENISQEEKKIGEDLDNILRILQEIYGQMKDPENKEPIDLDTVQEQIAAVHENVRNLDGNMPTSPFEGVDLNAVSREHVENKILPHLESLKRNKQNAIPQLMTKLQLTVQLYTAIIEALRGTADMDRRLGEHMARNMAR